MPPSNSLSIRNIRLNIQSYLIIRKLDFQSKSWIVPKIFNQNRAQTRFAHFGCAEDRRHLGNAQINLAFRSVCTLWLKPKIGCTSEMLK